MKNPTIQLYALLISLKIVIIVAVGDVEKRKQLLMTFAPIHGYLASKHGGSLKIKKRLKKK